MDDPAARAGTFERQLFEVVAFLRSRELLHLDGHFGNMRADDDRLYLVDFGLATLSRFDLSDAERDFILTGVPALAVGVLTRHASAAARMNDFCRRLFDGDIHAQYPWEVVT